MSKFNYVHLELGMCVVLFASLHERHSVKYECFRNKHTAIQKFNFVGLAKYITYNEESSVWKLLLSSLTDNIPFYLNYIVSTSNTAGTNVHWFFVSLSIIVPAAHFTFLLYILNRLH